MGAHKGGDDTTAVDIAHQPHRHIRRAGKSHIGDIAIAQIDFRGTAGALYQYHLGIATKPVKGVEHTRHQIAFDSLIGAGVVITGDPALNDKLRADIRLRFQQDRVHVHSRLHPTGAGL